MDVLFIVITLVLFAIAWGFIELTDRISGG